MQAYAHGYQAGLSFQIVSSQVKAHSRISITIVLSSIVSDVV
jgi:hypothetical protein